MRIEQVASLFESVTPRYYGGTERVVSYLTEEVVRIGHEVTLFASADSVTKARLRPQAPMALRLDAQCLDPIPEHLLMMDQVTSTGAARTWPSSAASPRRSASIVRSSAKRVGIPLRIAAKIDKADRA